MLCNRRASRPSRGRLVGPAFALLIAAMMALIFAGNASAATPVPACEGTTEDPVPAGAYLLDGPREADLIAGRVVPLHDNFGRAGSLVPGCMARIQDGVIVSEWAYCTDENRGACIQVGDVRKDLVLQNPKFDVAVDPLGPRRSA